MSINKITGVMLDDDLTRNGSNLTFESGLLYIDVTNSAIGINTDIPAADLDINGILKIKDVRIEDATLLSPSGFKFDLSGSGLDVNFAQIINVSDPNELQDAATKAYVDSKVGSDIKDRIEDGDSFLKITDPGPTTELSFKTDAGTIEIFNIDKASADFFVDTNINANLQVQGQIIVDNLLFKDNILTSINGQNLTLQSSTNIIDLNGEVRHTTTQSNTIVYTDANNSIISNPSLTFDGTFLVLNGQAQIDNIIIDNNQITSVNDLILHAQAELSLTGTNGINLATDTGRDIDLAISGGGIVSIQGTTSLTIPVGTTAQRPTAPEQGAIRFNQNLNYPEVWNGVVWTQFGETFTSLSEQRIVPDGISSSFSLNQEASTESVLVSLNGILQSPITAYSVAGSTITFTAVPLVSDIISIRFFAAMAEVNAITDASGLTKVEALNTGVYIEVDGTVRVSFLGTFTEYNSHIIPSSNNVHDLGISAREFRNIYSSTYSSNFVGDNIYAVGTVMKLGGPNEVTSSSTYADPTLLGIVSYNDATTNTTIATSGKAICQVDGTVVKGDLLTSSNIAGIARVLDPLDYVPGCVIGKALQDFAGPSGNINIIITLF